MWAMIATYYYILYTDDMDWLSQYWAGCISEYLQNWNDLGPVSPELPHNIVPLISSIELQAHFTSGHTLRGFDLIRSSWGWYLNNPNGTQSPLIERFKDDGSFAYRYNKGYKDTSYTSHAHGWSTGPTSALTEYVPGLRITDRLGRSWRLSPQFGDLTHVEGGFATALGKFSASWEVTPQGYEIRVDTPVKTRSEILLPVLHGLENRVQLDQRLVDPAIRDRVLKVPVPAGFHLVKVS